MRVREWLLEALCVLHDPSEHLLVRHFGQARHAVATLVFHERRLGHRKAIHQARTAKELATSLALSKMDPVASTRRGAANLPGFCSRENQIEPVLLYHESIFRRSFDSTSRTCVFFGRSFLLVAGITKVAGGIASVALGIGIASITRVALGIARRSTAAFTRLLLQARPAQRRSHGLGSAAACVLAFWQGHQVSKELSSLNAILGIYKPYSQSVTQSVSSGVHLLDKIDAFTTVPLPLGIWIYAFLRPGEGGGVSSSFTR